MFSYPPVTPAGTRKKQRDPLAVACENKLLESHAARMATIESVVMLWLSSVGLTWTSVYL
jgi:hypothetical protein